MAEWGLRADSAVKPSGQLGKGKLERMHRMDECELSVVLLESVNFEERATDGERNIQMGGHKS